MKSIRIRQSVLDDIVGHARAEAPNECCGLLIGTRDIVERAAPARNDRASPTRYLINPEDHFAAIRAARASGLEVIGAYHSHPESAPVPSATDLAEAAGSGFVYLIVFPGSPGFRPEVRAYRFDAGNFQPVEIVPVA